MSFRRQQNRHDVWRSLVRENQALLSELPKEALASQTAFRDYVTTGTHGGIQLRPSVFELDEKALNALWTFINSKAKFDMDATLFTHFNEAYAAIH